MYCAAYHQDQDDHSQSPRRLRPEPSYDSDIAEAIEETVETCINRGFIHQPGPPFVLNSIIKDGDAGDCVVATLRTGTVVAYFPNLGYQGMDTCIYEACENINSVDDRDGGMKEYTTGLCRQTALYIQVNDCSTMTPTQNPTTIGLIFDDDKFLIDGMSMFYGEESEGEVLAINIVDDECEETNVTMIKSKSGKSVGSANVS